MERGCWLPRRTKFQRTALSGKQPNLLASALLNTEYCQQCPFFGGIRSGTGIDLLLTREKEGFGKYFF